MPTQTPPTLESASTSAIEAARVRQGARLYRLAGSPLITLLAFVLALLIGALVIALSDARVLNALGYFFQYPSDTFTAIGDSVSGAYAALFQGSIFNFGNDGSVRGMLGPIAGTLFTAAPLICVALGVAIAFRGGLFNIGGQGQIIAGAVGAGYVGFAVDLPPVLHITLAVVVGVIFGAFWGSIAGFLKARTGANEVITTIMLNYIAFYILNFIINQHGFSAGAGQQGSRVTDSSARLPRLLGDISPLNTGIIFAAVAAAVVWLILNRTTVGFRIRVVGLNQPAARTAGMSASSTTITTMLIAGALAGLGGVIIVLGGTTSYQVTPNVDAGIGFDAIAVALLGRSNPIGVVLAGLLFGALRQGGSAMQAVTTVPIDIVTVIQALIVLFVAAPALVREIFHLRQRYGSLTAAMSSAVAEVRRIVVVDPRSARIRAAISTAVVALLLVVVFGISPQARQIAVVKLSLPGASVALPPLHVNAAICIVVIAAIVFAAAVARFADVIGSKVLLSVAIAGSVLAFILWSVAGTSTGINVVSLLQGTLFPAAIPLILGATAGVIGERAGIVNVGLEGQLLLGAFTSAFVATVSGNVYLGIIAAAVVGVGLALVLGVMAIRYRVDQVIVGIVLNMFALGITSFLFIVVMSPNAAQFNTPGTLPVWKVPFLSAIPLIGPVLFQGTIFLYGTYALIAVVSYVLFFTQWGLRVRAVGEQPKASATVGIKVGRTRYQALILAGVVAGLAGAFLVVGSGSSGTFQINMSAGKGFIALAAVIFGRWTPIGAVLAALVFGFSDQLQSLLSQAGSPIDSNLLLTLPYIVTIVAVAGMVGRVRPPAALGR